MKEDTVWLEQLHAEATEHISSPALDEAGKKQLLNTGCGHRPTCRTQHVPYFCSTREKGLSYKEIAAMMSISVSMVEKHMRQSDPDTEKRSADGYIAGAGILVAGAELLKL